MTESGTKRRRPTITDVAELAGVAVGTVSRYINGQEVRRANRTEIERAVEALGFRRSAAANTIRTARTGVIGFLAPTFDEFHADLMNHLARLFRQSGRTMLIYRHEEDVRLVREAMDFFISHQVDALIMAGAWESTDISSLIADEAIPVIIYNNDVRGSRVDRVFVNNARSSLRAVSHLIEVGHSKIANCHGRLAESSGRLRREGFEQALLDHGIPLRDDYVRDGNWTREGGYSAVQSLMALDDPPTAIFSANYQMTFGILEWLREHGLRTPQDLSIVSFDDVDLFRLYEGGITAIAQPIAQVAEAIAGYAISRLSTEVSDIRSRTLECSIVLRASSSRVA